MRHKIYIQEYMQAILHLAIRPDRRDVLHMLLLSGTSNSVLCVD